MPEIPLESPGADEADLSAALRALVADVSSAVTLTTQAYTTDADDLSQVLGVTTGATDATITVLAAATAGVDAIQAIQKVDSAAGNVLVKSGGVLIAILTQQWDTVYLRSDGSVWYRILGKGLNGLLKRVNTQIVGPSTTAETVAATIPLPGGLLGLNGSLILDAIVVATNNANAKTFRGRLGGTGLNGATVFTLTMTSLASGRFLSKFTNRGAQNSQVGFLGGAGIGTSSAALGTAAVDLSADSNLYITLQNAGAPSDSLNIERYSVEVGV